MFAESMEKYKGDIMTSLTGAQKRKLKSLAHDYKPVVMIGQNGVTENIIKAMDKALFDHELIKLKFIAFKEDRKAISLDLAEKTLSGFVGLIGNMAIFYRRNPEDDKRKIRV